MTNKIQSLKIPVVIKPFMQQTYNYFSSKKGKDRFMKEYKLEVESKEPRIRQRKVAQVLDTNPDNVCCNRLGNWYYEFKLLVFKGKASDLKLLYFHGTIWKANIKYNGHNDHIV